MQCDHKYSFGTGHCDAVTTAINYQVKDPNTGFLIITIPSPHPRIHRQAIRRRQLHHTLHLRPERLQLRRRRLHQLRLALHRADRHLHQIVPRGIHRFELAQGWGVLARDLGVGDHLSGRREGEDAVEADEEVVVDDVVAGEDVMGDISVGVGGFRSGKTQK